MTIKDCKPAGVARSILAKYKEVHDNNWKLGQEVAHAGVLINKAKLFKDKDETKYTQFFQNCPIQIENVTVKNHIKITSRLCDLDRSNKPVWRLQNNNSDSFKVTEIPLYNGVFEHSSIQYEKYQPMRTMTMHQAASPQYFFLGTTDFRSKITIDDIYKGTPMKEALTINPFSSMFIYIYIYIYIKVFNCLSLSQSNLCWL